VGDGREGTALHLAGERKGGADGGGVGVFGHAASMACSGYHHNPKAGKVIHRFVHRKP
jgi:hypothetical protein